MISSRNEIEENKKKTIFLLFYFVLLFIAIGALIVVILCLSMGKDYTIDNIIETLFYFFSFSLIYSLIAYFFMNRITIGSVKGKEITEDTDNNDYKVVYNIVKELSLSARLPMPKVYIVPDESPNAFATGRDPEHATVSVTIGLLKIMNREEVEAVIGHELSHIKNYDIRVSTLAATLSSVIVGIGTSLIVTARLIFEMNDWSGGKDKQSLNAVIGIFAVGSLILGGIIKFIGIPLSRLIQYSISRQREYLADVSSTKLTNDPQGMINALEALEQDNTPSTSNLTVVRQLCLNSPKEFRHNKHSKKIHQFHGFDSHPPLEDRIARLKKLIGED